MANENKALDKAYFFNKARGFLVVNSIFGIIAVIGCLCFIFFTQYGAIGQLGAVIAVAWIVISFIRYYVPSEDDLEIVTATCVDRRRIGYRKQYFEYTFNIINEGQGEEKNNSAVSSFEMKSATKEKFKKDITYVICFKKPKTETSVKYGSNLICFEIYN